VASHYAARVAPLDLAERHLDLVRAVLARHVSDRTVVAFGSRAKGTAKPWSDLDLAILDGDPLPDIVFARLVFDFEESLLPMRVEVVERSAVSEALRASIDADGVLVRAGQAMSV